MGKLPSVRTGGKAAFVCFHGNGAEHHEFVRIRNPQRITESKCSRNEVQVHLQRGVTGIAFFHVGKNMAHSDFMSAIAI
jgi:hypothetical protein